MSNPRTKSPEAHSGADNYTFKRGQSRTDLRCADPCKALLGKYDASTEYAIQIKCHQRNCKKLNTIGNFRPSELVEVRCNAIDVRKSKRAGVDTICNKLLAKVAAGTLVQIRCPRCGAFIESSDVLEVQDGG